MFALADCNNFFVSCERLFRPDLAGRPVIVLSNNDGCTIARSNEAKALGIKMGDPLFKIRPIVERYGVTVFSGNMPLYADISHRVKSVLRDAVPSIEVYSIDEAFLDLRGVECDFDGFAKMLSAKCLRHTGIPVSVGIAPTKTLAKIAAHLCKQYPKLQGGCYMHRPQDIEKVLRRYPIDEVWGIGRRSNEKLRAMGIATAYDFTQLSREKVQAMFSIVGVRTWLELQGEPAIEFEEAVLANRSIANTRSFAREIDNATQLAEQVALFASMTAEKLRKQQGACQQLTVFARTNRFKTEERQLFGNEIINFERPTNDTRILVAAARQAVKRLFVGGCAYKKAGVIATKIVDARTISATLFDDEASAQRSTALMQTIDTINRSYGRSTIKIGSVGRGEILNNCSYRSPAYTTKIADFPKIKG